VYDLGKLIMPWPVVTVAGDFLTTMIDVFGRIG
jgi:hypothetical protein